METELSTVSQALAKWRSDFAASPDVWHQPGVCRYCGTALPEPHLIMSETGAFQYPVTSCEPCIVTRRAEYDREQEAKTHASLTRFCPPDFAEQWDETKGNNVLLSEARKHFSITAKRGLILHGASGRCKTRVAWELIKDIEARPPFDGFVWKFTDGFECATKGITSDLYNAGLIVLDDLGNEPTGTKFETSLLHLLRKRGDYHRPTILTTQLTGQQFAARFFAGVAGAAILRRLRERCTAIAG